MKETNNKTEIMFILDKSGSMACLTEDTVGGFNSLIEKQRGEEGECYVSTLLFDSDRKLLHDRLPLDRVPRMTAGDYTPCGSTALFDAVGWAIRHISDIHKYARPEDIPGRTVFVITTDGMENASHRYGREEIRRLIREKREKGWEFLFLGANIDAAETADSMGISRERAVNYHADSEGTKNVYDSIGDALCSVRACISIDDGWKERAERDYRSRKRR